jgi:hypothetical protein
MWICFGMATVGLLTGTLVAMSSGHLSKTILALIFGLLGGSISAFFSRIPKEDRHVSGAALFSLSFGCLVGLYSGVLVTQYEWLTPVQHRFWPDHRPVNAKSSGQVDNNGTNLQISYTNGLNTDALSLVLKAYKRGDYSLDDSILLIQEMHLDSTAGTP